MRAVIISGGSISDYCRVKKHIKEEDVIICADSGYIHAKNMGIKVDYVVGDFDSVGAIPLDVKTIQYPTKKDLTDTEIAVEHGRKLGFQNFLIIGATGSRMDHTLSNILMLKEFLDRGEYAEIIDGYNKIMITNSCLHLFEFKGATVSLLPLQDCYGVTTNNLEYELNDAVLYVGKGRGVSNVMTKDEAKVSIKTGILFVMVTDPLAPFNFNC